MLIKQVRQNSGIFFTIDIFQIKALSFNQISTVDVHDV